MRTRSVWGLASRAITAATVLMMAAYAAGHPSHSSYAEVEWSEQGSLDVALRVIPEDLERALSLKARGNVVLVDTPEVRALLAAYIDEHFRVLNSDSNEALTLVGLELDYRETWIYFSLPVDESRQGALLNTLLMDVEPTQTNRVRRLWAPEAPVLVFSTEEPQRDLMVPDVTQ